MLIDAANTVTHISENDEINSENFLESLTFIDNLYKVIDILKQVIPMKEVVFEPTFKGQYTCKKYDISSTELENEMKLFIIKSCLFLEDTDRKQALLTNVFNGFAKTVAIAGDQLLIILN